MTVLCMGEALVDLVPQQDGSIRPQPGGGAWNTALALGRLGVPTSFVWPISRDAHGALLLGPLAVAGVETSLCPRSDRPTALARIDLNFGDAIYCFDDANSAGRMFAPEQLPPLPPDCTANHAYQPVEIIAGEARRSRDEVYEGLKKFNVFARRYFHPLLTTCAPYQNARKGGELPVAQRVARQILTLPIHHDLPAASVHRICDILLHLLSGDA